MAEYAPILELTRGGIRESLHHGAVAIVDCHGRLLASHGDPDTRTFLRSTAKPFQALPFIEAGGAEAYALAPEEIALICASHAGTDEHQATAARIQAKAGLSESQLLCGTHPPYDKSTAEALQAQGLAPTPNRHNCSGKHSGMLAFARLKGWPLENYIDPGHPVQQAILAAFADMCGLAPQEVVIGIDGCSAPNFAVPLYNAALGLARLCDPHDLPPARQAACETITATMTGNPIMVSGPGRFDTRLMEVTGGRVLSKGGAEGYQGLGIAPGVLGEGSPGVGVAFKIADGDLKGRVRPAVALEVLRQLGAVSQAELEQLAEFGPQRAVRNWRKIKVGVSRPVFRLEFA